jgi:hypothetical protein
MTVETNDGVALGYLLLPILFNVYIDIKIGKIKFIDVIDDVVLADKQLQQNQNVKVKVKLTLCFN